MIRALDTTRTGANHMRAHRMRASVPAMGPWVPTATVHLVFLAVAVGLCLLVLDRPFWIGVGLLLAVAGTFIPHLVAKGWVIGMLALGQLWREPSATDVSFYLLLAGVHLLHVLGSLAGQIPWHGRMQTGAFVRPLQRFVLVQTVVQAVAVGALLAFGGGRGTVPGLSILSAALLGIVAAVLARALRHARGRG